MDIAGNLSQIGHWTLKGFHHEQRNIELFLKLTRKDFDALTNHPLPKAFQKMFTTLCKAYDELEDEFHSGISDHRVWADGMHTIARNLTKHSHLV